MEDSSPLAAMHRPVPVPSWGGNDLFRSHAHSHLSGGAGSLSLRERLHKPNPDYFNVKDVRGSSPAASLAADLSQNFRLDSDARYADPSPWHFRSHQLTLVHQPSLSYTTPCPVHNHSRGIRGLSW